MSTFQGQVEEISGISIDRFSKENIYSTVYFLSHCHADHMMGLEDWNFQTSLIERPNVFLYASSISIKILKHKIPNIQCKLKELPIDTTTLITFPNDSSRTLSVIAIPAGHCPGSVMFLFESDKNILYTGDYRIQLNDLKKFKAFYSLGQMKEIHKIYLDTTFFSKLYNTLPLRQEAAEIISTRIKKWISQSKRHIIKIVTSATYGSEYLFAEIAKNVGMPIHVRNSVFNVYKCVPELDTCVTLNGTDTQIHASCGYSYREICCTNKNDSVLTIKPSVLWWRGKDFKNGIFSENNGVIRVCYSSHASFEEIKEFLMFLKPSEIEPCVIPYLQKDEQQLRDDISMFINSYQHLNSLHGDECEIFNTSKVEFNNSLECTTENKLELLDDILNSPPKNFKRRRLWLDENEDCDKELEQLY